MKSIYGRWKIKLARSKEFNEGETLDKAMVLFWEKGYEKTSIQDLVDHMSIHRRSIYDTFGDKRSLFAKALGRYEEIIASGIREQVSKEKTTIEAIRKIFEFTIHTDSHYPKGCLLVNTAIELSLLDEEIAQQVKLAFKKTEDYIGEVLREGQIKGEVANTVNINELSRYLHNSLIGIRVLVKVTSDPKELDSTIDLTLSLLK